MAVQHRLHTLSPIESFSERPTVPPLREAHTALLLDATEWLMGKSPAIIQLRSQIRRVAPYFRTALLTGEPGCGEAAAAHLLHQLSPLSQRPFIELTAVDAELRLGLESTPLSVAEEGMLYLPQPERLSRRAQMALVRLLREHGSRAPRIVAFSQRGLRSLVSSGGFCAELADALGALRVSVPPLRERGADIPELLMHAIQIVSAQRRRTSPHVTPELLDAAVKLPWPHNLAQLHAAAEALLDTTGDTESADNTSPQAQPLRVEDLKAVLGAIPEPCPREIREISMLRLDDVIHEHIRSVLLACNGNKLRSAEVLGISRSTLYRMLETRGMHTPLQTPEQTLQIAG